MLILEFCIGASRKHVDNGRGKRIFRGGIANMKLSTRSRYGTRLLLDLAQHLGEGPVQLKSIAERQSIPVKYLEQIVIPLRKARILKSTRGYLGGYTLARSPGDISLGEVVAVLEGGRKLTSCTADPDRCKRSATCVTRWLWGQMTEAMYQKLDSITVAELFERARDQNNADCPIDQPDPADEKN
jgi:Rrf2 family transcriptional regulator, iron-sulfur cluster assembly transcription factor